MVNTMNLMNLVIAALFAGSVSALPLYSRDASDLGIFAPPAGQQAGTGIPPGFGNDVAADEQASAFAAAATSAAAAEAAAGVDITASIAAASSSAAAAAATATVNPLDPLQGPNTNLTPAQLGELSGLRAKLAIDTQFGDTGAAIHDQSSIDSIIASGEDSEF
ncbi:hypothetical protein B0H11DRAFT_2009732 [Mycena galericulata]|nr:hypothetical protein B0H11DRAFT_2106326 [Mycena galericulata]KAJ7490246.1 hypothetical protein B0H11DRAFT_2009732 [Mycena galericulata]